MWIDGLGWAWIRPLEYGNLIAYQQRPRTARALEWLFDTAVCAFEPSAADVRRMRAGVPAKLEYGVLRASGAGDGDETGERLPDRSDYREDSPFARTAPSTDQSTIEDSFHWLHRQGYTFAELYGLLVGEIEQLHDGFERHQQRQQDAGAAGETGESAARAHGNKGDRASQLGWR